MCFLLPIFAHLMPPAHVMAPLRGQAPLRPAFCTDYTHLSRPNSNATFFFEVGDAVWHQASYLTSLTLVSLPTFMELL